MVQIFQRESIFCSKISSGWSVFGNRKVIVSFHTLYARTWTAKQAHTANYTIGSRDTAGARPHGPRTQTQPSHEAIFGFGRSLYTVEIHKIPDHGSPTFTVSVAEVVLYYMIEVQDTEFYACGHKTNQNSGMQGTKAKTSCGVLAPKMALSQNIKFMWEHAPCFCTHANIRTWVLCSLLTPLALNLPDQRKAYQEVVIICSQVTPFHWLFTRLL